MLVISMGKQLETICPIHEVRRGEEGKRERKRERADERQGRRWRGKVMQDIGPLITRERAFAFAMQAADRSRQQESRLHQEPETRGIDDDG